MSVLCISSNIVPTFWLLSVLSIVTDNTVLSIFIANCVKYDTYKYCSEF